MRGAEAVQSATMSLCYCRRSVAQLIASKLSDIVCGCDAMAVTRATRSMTKAVRNLGNHGLAAMAISAVDTALWDFKARRLGLPLLVLLGAVRDNRPYVISSHAALAFCGASLGLIAAGPAAKAWGLHEA